MDRDPRERLVYLHEIQVLRSPPRLLERQLPALPGTVSRFAGSSATWRKDDGPQRLEVPPFGEGLAREQARAPAPSVTPGALPAVTVPPSSIGGSAASFSRGQVAPDRLVGLDVAGLSLAARHLDTHDLLGELAIVRRGWRRLWLRRAQRSWSSREISNFSLRRCRSGSC